MDLGRKELEKYLSLPSSVEKKKLLMGHKRTVHILTSDELSKEMTRCFQRLFSFMFKVDFETRLAGMNPSTVHIHPENIQVILFSSFQFSHLQCG
jgi:hypothetical protein